MAGRYPDIQHDRLMFSPTISDRDGDTVGSGVSNFSEDTFFKNGIVVDYPGEGKMLRARPGVEYSGSAIATGVTGSPGAPIY